MIQLYTNNQQDITKNGIILNPVDGKISPKLNGENELEMEVVLDKDGLYKHITRGCLITVPTPDFAEDQAYRIYDTVKNMSSNTMTIYARHIQFDLNKKVIFNKTVQGNGQQVIDKILGDTKFKGTSDSNITDIRQYKLRNITNVINGNEEDSFINIWGGEIECNNYDLNIPLKRGKDRGIRVTFGYNLEDIEEDLNSDELVTRIYPYSGDITLSGTTPYVDSLLITKYSDVYEQPIEMADIKVKENAEDEGFNSIEEARAEMIKRCKELYNRGVDKIKANYKVKMRDLSKTLEYKRLGYDVLEKVCLGDTVHCYNKNIDIEVSARCISYIWDIVNQEFIEIELGQFISSYIDNNLNDLDNLYRKVALEKQNILLKVDGLNNDLHAEIKIVEEGITSNVNKHVEIINNTINSTKDELENDITSNVNAINNTISVLKQDTNSSIEQLSNSITSDVNSVKEEITANTSNLQGQIDSAKSSITDTNTLIDNVKNNINATISANDTDAQNNLNSVRDNLSKIIGNDKTELQGNIDNVNGRVDTISNNVTNVRKESLENIEQAKIDLNNVINEATSDKATTASLEQARNSLLKALEDKTINKADLEELEQAKKDLNDTINTATIDKATKEELINTKNNIEKVINDTKNELNTNITTINKNIEDNSSKITQLDSKITSEVSSAKDELNIKIDDTNSNIAKVEETVTDMGSKVEQLPNSITSTVAEAKTELQGQINGINGDLANTVSNKNLMVNAIMESSYGKVGKSANQITHCEIVTTPVYAYSKAPVGNGKALHVRWDKAGDNYISFSNIKAKVKPNTTYTFSFYYVIGWGDINTFGASSCYLYEQDVNQEANDNPNSYINPISLPLDCSNGRSDWRRKTYTFTTQATTTQVLFRAGFGQNGDNFLEGLFTGFQLEEGNVVTDFVNGATSIITSSPVVINQATQIQQLSDQINNTVTKDQFGSLVQQNYDSVAIAVKNKTSMKATFDTSGLTMQSGGFRIKKDGNSTFKATDDGSVIVYSPDGNAGFFVDYPNGSTSITDNGFEMERGSRTVNVDSNGIEIKHSSHDTYMKIQDDEIYFYDDSSYNSIYIGENNKLHVTRDFYVDDDLYVDDWCKIEGDLDVTGDKDCLQHTENYGDLRISAYETAEYYFGDLGEGIINEQGECIVYIEAIFRECVNTDINYHVFIQNYNGNIAKIERYADYFIVYGEEGTEFSWELKAKRKGRENTRLEKVPYKNKDKETEGILLNTLKTEDNTVENILLNEIESEEV